MASFAPELFGFSHQSISNTLDDVQPGPWMLSHEQFIIPRETHNLFDQGMQSLIEVFTV